MKTYAIVGNQYEGLYTKPWSAVQSYTKTKPAPKFKGFTTRAEAEIWFNQQKDASSAPDRQYTTAYDGNFIVNPNHYYLFTDGGNRNTGNITGGHVKSSDPSGWAIAAFSGQDMVSACYTDAKAVLGRTNNEMEVTALFHALQYAKQLDGPITIVSDSKYVLDTVTNWMYNWQSNSWKKASGPIANLPMWQAVFKLTQELYSRLHFIWVKGHATSNGNVLVDQLLNRAMDNLS